MRSSFVWLVKSGLNLWTMMLSSTVCCGSSSSSSSSSSCCCSNLCVCVTSKHVMRSSFVSLVKTGLNLWTMMLSRSVCFSSCSSSSCCCCHCCCSNLCVSMTSKHAMRSSFVSLVKTGLNLWTMMLSRSVLCWSAV